MATIWVIFLFAPLLLGVLIYALDKPAFNRSLFVLQGLLTLGFAYFVLRSPFGLVLGHWPKTVGIELISDFPGLIFTGMTLVAFWFILLYDWSKHRTDHKYLFLICALQTVLLTLSVAYDLFTLFILIELMTIIASVLITYKKDSVSVKAGIYYLLVNSLSMVFYIMGVMLLYSLTGTLNIGEVLVQLSQINQTRIFDLALVFFTVSIAVKSAWFPLFHWLPIAHSAAPGSVSAILSGLIVKTGLLVLIRLGPLLQSTAYSQMLLYLGLVTALVGVSLAALQSDIKRVLSFHTVSQLGLILVGLSVGGGEAAIGGILHLLNHFLFKSLLFLCAGLIITQTGQRNLKRISGLMKLNPVLSVFMIIGILGITGFPLMNGQLSKILIKASADVPLVKVGLSLVNLGTLISFMKFYKIFVGAPMVTLVDPKPRQKAVYLMGALTLMAFPIELVLLSQWMPKVATKVMGSLLSSTWEFTWMAFMALILYSQFLSPALKSGSVTLQRIKQLGIVYIGEFGALLMAFITGLHIYLQKW